MPSSTPLSSTTPTAHTIGPTVIGSRGPIRAAMIEVREESSSIVIGSTRVATPAWIGSYPSVTWSCSTRKNSTAPRAPYTSSVIRLAALNVRDRNIDNGAIAPGRSSKTMKAHPAATTRTQPRTITTGGSCGHEVSRYVETPSATIPLSAPR